mgnify:CR=1 FL=1
MNKTVWLFDLDDTLHDASHAALGGINKAMTEYVARHVGLSIEEASALRQHYWQAVGQRLNRIPETRLVDKSPLNFTYAAELDTVFPHAQWVFAVRHPARLRSLASTYAPSDCCPAVTRRKMSPLAIRMPASFDGLSERSCSFAIRTDTASRIYYDRKRAQGKRHTQAVLALARRRLNVMWAMLRDHKPYQPAAPNAAAA